MCVCVCVECVDKGIRQTLACCYKPDNLDRKKEVDLLALYALWGGKSSSLSHTPMATSTVKASGQGGRKDVRGHCRPPQRPA